MDWQWLLDQLKKIPGLGDAVRKVEYAYDIWKYDTNDSQPLRTHAQLLHHFHDQTKPLVEAMNNNLYNLQQTWHGDVADLYLGQITAFAIEHDQETVGLGYQMWQNLAALRDTLQLNATSHEMGAQRLDKLGEKKVELDVGLGAAMVLAGAMIAAPELEPIEDGGFVADAGIVEGTATGLEATAGATEAIDIVATTGGISATILTVALIVGGIAGAALAAFFLLKPHSAANNPPTNNKKPDPIVYPPSIANDPAKEAIYKRLLAENVYIAYLYASGFSETNARQIYNDVYQELSSTYSANQADNFFKFLDSVYRTGNRLPAPEWSRLQGFQWAVLNYDGSFGIWLSQGQTGPSGYGLAHCMEHLAEFKQYCGISDAGSLSQRLKAWAMLIINSSPGVKGPSMSSGGNTMYTLNKVCSVPVVVIIGYDGTIITTYPKTPRP